MKPKQTVSPERAAAIEALKQKWVRKNQLKQLQEDKTAVSQPKTVKQKDEPKKG